MPRKLRPPQTGTLGSAETPDTVETLTTVKDCADYICCSAHVLRSNGEVMAEFVRGLVDKGNAKDAVAQMFERNTRLRMNQQRLDSNPESGGGLME